MTQANSKSLVETWQTLSGDKRKAFAALLRKRGIDVHKLLPVPAVERGGLLPLSYAQERMWFLAQLEPDSAALHIAGAFYVDGALEGDRVQAVIDALVQRHESLRSAFGAESGRPSVELCPNARCVVERFDLGDCAEEQREARLLALIEAHVSRPFDLRVAPLLRVGLVRLGPERHALAIALHHIIADGWSLDLLLEEFTRLYAGVSPAELPRLPVQYVDFAAWQRDLLGSGELERQLRYWTAQLGAEQPALSLPVDHPRAPLAARIGGSHAFRIGPALSARAARAAQREGATLFMWLLSVFELVLYRWSGQTDLRVGVPVTNRPRVEFEPLVGLFVNTHVLRANVDGAGSFRDLLGQVKEASLGAQSHADLPFEQLVDALRPERNLDQNPLFQVMYNHEERATKSASADAVVPDGALRFRPLSAALRATQFELDLETSWDEARGEISGAFNYAAELFDPRSIELLAGRFERMLERVVDDPGLRLAQLEFLVESERAELLALSGPRALTRAPAPGWLHERIAEQARLRPAAVALLGEPDGSSLGSVAEAWTYAQLERESNGCAQLLRALGVRPELRVGLCVARTPRMVMGALAIWKAGGALVALDPSQPLTRLQAVVADAELGLLVAERALPVASALGVERCVWLDDADFGAQPAHAPEDGLCGANLAYVVYTSGSTGRPKGVGVSHAALADHIAAVAADYAFEAEDTALQFSSLGFDAALEQWALPLACGARVVLRGDAAWSAERALSVVRELGVTWLDLPPAYLRELARDALSRGERVHVRGAVVGGEALSREGLQLIARALAPARVINGYGPTEAVITPMTWHAASDADCTTAYAPIGRVVGARSGYVLDAEQNLVPVGVTGELYLGGSSLARGYIGRSAWTAERFVPDPYAAEPGARMYRTGDLARVMEGGEIEFLGRADHQVKVRGFRVELGEVESQLMAADGVRDAVVVAQGGAVAARLIGYVVGEVDLDALRLRLAAALPDYMLPAVLLSLPELPRDAHGKVDRKRLPEPERPARVHVAPRTEPERVLVEIWQAVLDLDLVSVTDNFFELGGDSIVSIQVVSRARQAGLALTARDMFQHQTIEALARVAVPAGQVAIDQGPVVGELPLSPIQLDFLESGSPEPDHYNQAMLLRSAGPLDVERLERAVSLLLQHHDALRLRCARRGDGWFAEYTESTPAAARSLWLRSASDRGEIEALCEEAQRSLSLERGEIVRVLYIDVADGSSRLLFVVHHMAVDGVSWRILLEDLERAYAGERSPLPPKSSAFGAFSAGLRACAQTPELARELDYWQAALSGACAELRRDTPAEARDCRSLQHVELRLDRERTTQLLRFAPAAYRTQIQDLLLTALTRAMTAEQPGASLLLELESHGRTELVDGVDVSRTVGWFTSRYPVLLDAHGELPSAIRRVKEQLRAVPNHGIGHGVLAHFGSAAQRAALAALPRPRVSFNYLGQFDAAFEAAGSFGLAEESGGAEWSPDTPLEHWLEISGQVFAGELGFSVAFDERMFRPDTVRRLLQRYEQALHELIAHCITPGVFGRTPSDYPLANLTQAQLEASVGPAPGAEDIYPLTPMQKGMLFHALYAEGESVYVTQLDVEISGLDPERFVRAWQRALDRHAILRTSFVWRGLPAPLQRVHDAATALVELEDLRSHPDPGAFIADWKARELARGFSLERAPLWRIGLARLDERRHHFVWTCHHLLLDGWSTARLLDEVLLDYLGRELPPPGAPFSRYLEWLGRRPAAASEAFWRARLEPLTEPTSLTGNLPVAAGSDRQQLVATQLPAPQTARLLAFAQREHVTINALVQAAWLLILQRYTGQAAVVLGATMSGRPPDLAGSEQMLGLFINTLPVVAAPQPEWSVREFVQRLQADNLAIREYEHTPLADIQRWAGFGGRGLFDTLLVFENYPVDKALGASWDGIAFGEVSSVEATNYALTLGVSVSDRLDVAYGFTGAAFDRAHVERLGAQLLTLLGAFVEQPEARLGNLPLGGEPRALQLGRAPEIEHESESEPFLDRAIARHAHGAARDRVAVVSRSERLTFAELERESNRLAERLLRSGVQPGCCVGVCLPREASFIVSALAIWKVGGAYLSLDAQLPAERLRFMIDDAGAELVVTNAALREALPQVHVLCLDQPDTERAPPEVGPPANVARSGEQLAYVIYTSGSTGLPKGVGVSHAAISMHCRAVAEIYAIRKDDCALHFAPFGFDASVEQWCVSLLGGGSIRISDDEPWTPEELDRVIERDRVTIVYPPVSHMLQLAQSRQARGQRHAGLRVCCIGGEAMSKGHVELIRSWLAPRLLVNGYGPTETVVTPLLWAAGSERPCDTAYAPIGEVVGDRSAYVLDRELNILPAGVTGELYIGGSGLARGYRGRAGLTAERFVADPFSTVPGARMYRTGDLVRMLEDGAIEYIARIDHQVKLRGFRIELGEIEAALLEQPGVLEAHALVHEAATTKTLIAYVAGAELQREAGLDLRLREALRARLPEPMVPSRFIALESLPRTRHGKVDRARLPRPELEQRAYEPPAGELERALSELWREILGATRVGRADNFFELGGDSILSILLVSRAREQGFALTPRQLFAHPTLAALASVVRREPVTSETAAATLAESGEGEVPLTPIQRAFFAEQRHDRYHFNLSVLLRPARALDGAGLERALLALVAHHPVLRFHYRVDDGAVIQHARPASDAQPPGLCRVERVRPSEIEEACQRAQRSLDLVRGPLVRALMLDVSDGSQRLLFVVHHLVADGVSVRYLLDDLETAYLQLERGLPVALPPSSASFEAWAKRLVEHATGPAMTAELAHWQRELDGVKADLPRDRASSEPLGPGQVADSCSMTLPAGATRTLLTAAPSVLGAQVQDVLLAALARALSAWTGEAAHLVELEGHGRDAPFDDVDLTRCIGWFTRLYPLRLETAGTLAETVQRIKQRREQLPDAGFGYGVLRELAPEAQRSQLRELPRPRITFNYLGQFDASFEAEGLWAPAAEGSGDEVSARAAHANWISLDAEVSGDQFGCTLRYDPRHFGAETMARLLDEFQAQLSALAEQAARSNVLALDASAPGGLPRDAREADDMALKPRQYGSSPLVQLATGNLAEPLFCLHPLGGVVFDYHILARRLAGRRSVYGLQCRTLVDPSWLDHSIEDMAHAYARLIASAQPEGAYHLLGWSFGADLAIETAHVLEQTGRRVAFLGLVDRLVHEGPVLEPDAEDDSDVIVMASNLMAARYPTFSREELLSEARGLRERGVSDRDAVRALVGRVTGQSPDQQEGFDLEGLLVMHGVLQNMHRLAEGFALKRLHVAPHCWWSSDSQSSKSTVVRTLEQGLGQHSALDVDVPSNHLQIIYDETFVTSLAAALQALESSA